MNPYRILGVPKDSTSAQINSAYRTRSKTAHPDSGGNEEAFKILTQAYNILKDPARRKLFDEQGITEESRVAWAAVEMFITETIKDLVKLPIYTDRDPLKGVIYSLIRSRSDIQRDKLKANQKIKELNSLINCLSTSQDKDPVGDALRSQVSRLEKKLKEYQESWDLSIEVERVLRSYTFEGRDPGPEGQHNPESPIRAEKLRRLGIEVSSAKVDP